MKLQKKLMLAPIVILVMQALSFTALLWVFQNYKSSSYTNHRQVLRGFENISRAQLAFSKQHAGLYRTIAISNSMDDAAVAKLRLALVAHLAELTSDITNDTQIISSEAMQKAVQSLTAQTTQYAKSADEAIDLSTMDANTGIAAMQTAEAKFVEIDTSLSAIVELIQGVAATDLERLESRAAAQRLGVGLLALLLGVGSIIFAWRMQRQIVKDLAISAQATQSIATGQLDITLESDRTDELGDMVRSLGAMVAHLHQTIELVQQTADIIVSGSHEISSDNQELKTRMDEQVVSLEATVSAMRTITSTVTQNADNAFKANQLAESASEVALKGGLAVTQVVTTMESIHVSAKKIVDIISVIDGIAFQTNILALNAAVEAARAGESGRGFAVVAAEVRALAQRSATAAREIKTLITSSGELIQTGTQLADQAGATMHEIVSSVQNVTRLLSEIAQASQAQREEIEQVNTSIGHIDEATHKNSALVQQTAAAAVTLQTRASYLAKAIGAFQLDQRASPRKPIVCDGKLCLPSGESVEMQTVDLSLSGAGITLSAALAKGQSCEMHCEIPLASGQSQHVIANAQVSYCEAIGNGHYKAGLFFTAEQRNLAEQLVHFLA